MYIILREENQYDQYGQYFVAAFSNKPSIEEIQKIEDFSYLPFAEHILAGGGRRNWQDTWYILVEYEEGTSW